MTLSVRTYRWMGRRFMNNELERTRRKWSWCPMWFLPLWFVSYNFRRHFSLISCTYLRPARPILWLIILKIIRVEYKLWKFPLFNFHHRSMSSNFFCRNLYLLTRFSLTRWFPDQFLRHTAAPPGPVISPSQGLYLHRTTQHKETKDKHPCLKRNSNPRSGEQALRAPAFDLAATITSTSLLQNILFSTLTSHTLTPYLH
jgi:hypothetical protein